MKNLGSENLVIQYNFKKKLELKEKLMLNIMAEKLTQKSTFPSLPMKKAIASSS